MVEEGAVKKLICAFGSAFVLMAVTPVLAKSPPHSQVWHGSKSYHSNYAHRGGPYYSHPYRYGSYWYYPYSYAYYPYGGFVGEYVSDNSGADDFPVGAIPAAPLMLPVAPPPSPLTCKHSQEIKTVPSEDGGEKQIRITRC